MRIYDRIVAVVSAGIILYEITLTRIFSVLMWYHFVSFAVALALGGMAFGSLAAVGLSGESEDRAGRFVYRWAFFSAVGCLVVYFLLVLVSSFPSFGYKILSPLHQTYYEPFSVGNSGGGFGFVLVTICLLILVSTPFLGGGAVFASCFQRSRNSYLTYGYSTAGAAAGVLLYLLVMRLGSAPGALVFSSLVFFLCTLAQFGGGKGNRFYAYSFGAVLVALIFVNYSLNPADPSFVRGRYEPRILWSRWDATSRVVVFPAVEEELLRGFGQGDGYEGTPPKALGMVVDDTGYTLMFKDPTGEEMQGFRKFFEYNLASLPFHLVGEGNALIIGPGGGKDILAASASGDFQIVAVELNRLVVKAVEEVFSGFTGRPYSSGNVVLVLGEGRSFLEGDGNSYDVIEMTQVFGRVPPQAGAFTLTENHLYTVEAFVGMLEHLKEEGVLSITRFHFEKTGPRLVMLVLRALRETGVAAPEKHLFIAGARGVMNVMAWKSRPSEEMIGRFLRICSEKGFQVVYHPDMSVDERNPIGMVAAGLLGSEAFRFDVTPPTDDRPFFYYTVRKEDFLRGKFPGGKNTEERGAYLVRIAIPPLCVFSLMALLVSAGCASGRTYGKRFFLFAAFFLSGLAFVFMEVLLIKKLILLLGFPVYSLSVVLLSVLSFSALGAFAFSYVSLGEKGKVMLGGLAVTFVLLGYRVFIDDVLKVLLSASSATKVASAFVLAGIPSFFAGIPFPSLLEIYNRRKRAPVAFPLFVNGLASVVGSFLIIAVSLNYGYSTLTLLTGMIYALVALFAGAGG